MKIHTPHNNKQPICYVALSSQKNYRSLYLIGAFWSAPQFQQLKAAFKVSGKKLDMGKCCVHFESPDDLPLAAFGKLISAISSEEWIEMYEQSRLRTKAGQAQRAKQGATKAATGRDDTKIGAKLSRHDLAQRGHHVLSNARTPAITDVSSETACDQLCAALPPHRFR